VLIWLDRVHQHVVNDRVIAWLGLERVEEDILGQARIDDKATVVVELGLGWSGFVIGPDIEHHIRHPEVHRRIIWDDDLIRGIALEHPVAHPGLDHLDLFGRQATIMLEVTAVFCWRPRGHALGLE